MEAFFNLDIQNNGVLPVTTDQATIVSTNGDIGLLTTNFIETSSDLTGPTLPPRPPK